MSPAGPSQSCSAAAWKAEPQQRSPPLQAASIYRLPQTAGLDIYPFLHSLMPQTSRCASLRNVGNVNIKCMRYSWSYSYQFSPGNMLVSGATDIEQNNHTPGACYGAISPLGMLALDNPPKKDGFLQIHLLFSCRV